MKKSSKSAVPTLIIEKFGNDKYDIVATTEDIDVRLKVNRATLIDLHYYIQAHVIAG